VSRCNGAGRVYICMNLGAVLGSEESDISILASNGRVCCITQEVEVSLLTSIGSNVSKRCSRWLYLFGRSKWKALEAVQKITFPCLKVKWSFLTMITSGLRR
jgi:hypothetical protein